MTRWHKATCESPDVVSGDDKLPLCRACGAQCPSLQELRSRQRPSPSLTIPPNEPVDQRNLWWPRSVGYVDEAGNVISQAQVDEFRVSLAAERDSDVTDTNDLNISAPIYGPALKADEFRLACLSAVSDPDYPVHLELEIYTDHDRPEYETVSYLWGGEENDSSLRHQVFIGPYWDVLLQTKNCWSMLRYIRPWRGSRMVWIDAVCINQENVAERSSQVAKMRNIYEQGYRVIVYLGDDIIAQPRRFPKYQRLTGLTMKVQSAELPPSHTDQSESVEFSSILNRRYFKRIWVIQELIASKEAIIRIGDIQLQADSTSFKPNDEEEQDFPYSQHWIKFLALGKVPKETIWQLLCQFCHSKASDPRDRLFGIISLLDDKYATSYRKGHVQPDYSLSLNHFAVGLFAHLLLKEDHWWLLRYARGPTHNGASLCPSWVPQLGSAKDWNRIFDDRYNDNACPNVFEIYNLLVPDDTGDTRTAPYRSVLQDLRWLCPVVGRGGLPRRARVKRLWLLPHLPSVESRTGILQLTVTDLFIIQRKPTLEAEIHGLGIYKIHNQEPNVDIDPLHHINRLGLYTMSRCELHTEVRPGEDRLVFVGDSVGPRYFLILREHRDLYPNPTFVLVGYCFNLMKLDVKPEYQPALQGPDSDSDQSFEQEEHAQKNFEPVVIFDSPSTFAETIEFIRAVVGSFKMRKKRLLRRHVSGNAQDTVPQNGNSFGMIDGHEKEEEEEEEEAREERGHLENFEKCCFLTLRWQQLLPLVDDYNKLWDAMGTLCRTWLEYLGPLKRRTSDWNGGSAYESEWDWEAFQQVMPGLGAEYVCHEFVGSEWTTKLHHIYCTRTRDLRCGNWEWRDGKHSKAYNEIPKIPFTLTPYDEVLKDRNLPRNGTKRSERFLDCTNISADSTVSVRAPSRWFDDILSEIIGTLCPKFEELMSAFVPPLDFDTALNLVKRFPMEEHYPLYRKLIKPTEHAGLRFDGTAKRVRIV